MSHFRAIILAAFYLALVVRTVRADDSTLTLRYQGFDAAGKAFRGSSLVLLGRGGDTIGSYREDGEKEQRIVLTDEAGRLRARISGPVEGRTFTAVFDPTAGQVLVGTEKAVKGWKPGLRDGNSSLFLILPRLLNLRSGDSRASYTIRREEDGQSAAFFFECRGPERLLVGGVSQEVYAVRMELADPFLHFVWPYVYHYYFRVSDLVMVRYVGPDAQRRMVRIDLQSTVKSLLAYR